jgi:VCBS repeat-containing protein
MAKIGKTTFSNSHAATADGFTVDDSTIDSTSTFNLLSQGDPGSASLYSIGSTATATTYLPTGTSGQVAVPTDLLTQDSAGYSIISTDGATVTILNSSSVTYQASASEITQVDALGAGQHLTDSFLYAIKMADGTVSWNTVSITLTGEAANIGVSDNGVQENDPPAGPVTGNVTDTVTVDAFAGSGNATGFTITADGDLLGPAGANLGSISPSTGSGHADLTYTVSNAAIYATHLGFGEFTQDNFTLTTTNGTTQDFSETIEGNIHTPDVTASAASSSIDEAGSVALNIAATDHDDNASLTYTLSGLPTGATLTDSENATLTIDNTGSITLTADQLAGLTLTPDAEFSGAIHLTVMATNTEGSATAQSSATIDVTVVPTADAPNLDVGAGKGNDNTAEVNEGGTVGLSITASHFEADQADPTITISADSAFTLNNYETHTGNSYTLTVADLSGLQLTAGEDGTLHLTVTATDTEADTTASTTDHITVTVDPVPEAPSLNLDHTDIAVGSTAGDAITVETTGVVGVATPMNISGADPDGDGTVSFTISGIPDDVTLANTNGTISHVGGIATLQQSDLAGLTVTAANSGDITFQVDAHNSEGGDTIGFVHWPVTSPDAGGPTDIGFAMNPQAGDQLDHLGTFFQIGDPDAGDTFTYSVGAGSDSGFVLTAVTGGAELDATGAAAGTDDLLNVVATDSANHSTTVAFHVWIGGGAASTATQLCSAPTTSMTDGKATITSPAVTGPITSLAAPIPTTCRATAALITWSAATGPTILSTLRLAIRRIQHSIRSSTSRTTWTASISRLRSG